MSLNDEPTAEEEFCLQASPWVPGVTEPYVCTQPPVQHVLHAARTDDGEILAAWLDDGEMVQ